MDPDTVRRAWADRSGAYSPEYYAYYGPNETSERIRSTLERTVGREASVLELGCSSGRHLSHLHADGFEDLAGVEVNGAAFDVMAESYPDLADAGTFHVEAIQDVVRSFDDGRFDAVYSVETLQHLPPEDEWVFAELARITDDVLVTVENEGDSDGDSPTDGPTDVPEVNYVTEDIPLYYRDWHRIFTDLGLDEVDVDVGERDTARTFRAST